MPNTDTETTVRIEHTIVSEFKGAFPELPLPEDVDKEDLGASFFFTLPIGKVGSHSRNGRVYTREAMVHLVEQVNRNRPEGRWGHLRNDQRATEYPPPALRWLVAEMDATGTVWGKGLAVTPEAERHLLIAKRTNSRIATSIYGMGTIDSKGEVIALELETIDLADPARAGIADTIGVPHLTSEMQTQSQREEPVPTTEKTEETTSVAEMNALKTERDAALQRVEELEEDLTNFEPVLNEVTQVQEHLTVFLSEMRDVAPNMLASDTPTAKDIEEKPSESVQMLLKRVKSLIVEMSNEITALLGRAMEKTVSEQVKLPTARPVIMELLKAEHPLTLSDVEAKLTGILERDYVKALLQNTMVSEMGPGQSRPAQPNNKPASYLAPRPGSK